MYVPARVNTFGACAVPPAFAGLGNAPIAMDADNVLAREVDAAKQRAGLALVAGIVIFAGLGALVFSGGGRSRTKIWK